jgi:endonuclease-3
LLIFKQPSQLKIRKERIKKLNAALAKLYPDAHTELNYKNEWQFLVAVQLSAQCTDKRVNIVTRELFKKYKKIEDYIQASPKEFEKAIHSVTYFHNKTKNILAAAKFIKEKYKGKLPHTMKELVEIPGVGRKTANVFLSEIHGIHEGVTVDTHVIRFVSRFDLSDYKDAVRIERDLMQLLPQKEWRLFTHRAIFYGRYLAPARKYDTSSDPLIKIYPPAAKRFRV